MKCEHALPAQARSSEMNMTDNLACVYHGSTHKAAQKTKVVLPVYSTVKAANQGVKFLYVSSDVQRMLLDESL